MLQSKGPFATVTLVQKAQFNGKSRPAASVIAEVMANLQTDGLGVVKKIDRTTVFLKQLPCHATEESLQAYGITQDVYGEVFLERASQELLSKDLFNRILQNSPQKQELQEIYFIIEEI